MFETSLSRSELVHLVRLFYDGQSDREIACELGNTNLDKTVARARVHLYLFRDTDFDLDHL